MSLGKIVALGFGLFASLVAARADAADYYTAEQYLTPNKSTYAQIIDIGHGYTGRYHGIMAMSFSNAILNKSYIRNPPKDSTLKVANGIGFDVEKIKELRFKREVIDDEVRYTVTPLPEYLLKEVDADGDKDIINKEAGEDFQRRMDDLN